MNDNNNFPMNNDMINGNMMNNWMNMNNPNLINNNFIPQNQQNLINNYVMNNNMNLLNNMALQNNMLMYNNMMNLLNFYNFYSNNINNNNNNTTTRLTYVKQYSNKNIGQKGILPREKRTDQYNVNFPGTHGNKINLFFQTPASFRVNLVVPEDAKMSDVLVQYVLKINLGPEVIDKDIYFLFGGRKLKKNERKTLQQLFIMDSSVIIVVDKSGILGA